MLEGNRSRVQNLTGPEIWMFIIGRVFVAFGIGVLAMTYFPAAAAHLAWPAVVVGLVFLVVASRGLTRKPPVPPTG